MIGILNGITGIRYGAERWCVQDVVNTERGEFSDIRVPEATSFFYETVFHPFGQCVVGEGDRGIVEIPANDNRVGGLLHMIFYYLRLFCPVPVGGNQTRRYSLDALRGILRVATGEFLVYLLFIFA